MSKTLRVVLAVVGAMALAALANPDVSKLLPAGGAQVIAMLIAAMLHFVDANPPATPPALPSGGLVVLKGEGK